MKIIYQSLNPQNPQDLGDVKRLVDSDISEPYSIYVYRYFLTQWPQLCLLAKDGEKTVGTIISKLEPHRNVRLRGYIGMVVVDKQYRKQGIAKTLVTKNIEQMVELQADEVILETESINKVAIKLYENLGFLRVKRLYRYYLNQHDAFRLILPISEKSSVRSGFLPVLDSDSYL